MAEHRWSILCARGVIDKYSNMLSLLEVTDELTIQEILEPVPDNPALDVNLHLVSMWFRGQSDQPEKFWCSCIITAPNGDTFETLSEPLEGNLETVPRTRLIFRIQSMPFRGAGTYYFDVVAAESPAGPFPVVARVPLEIKMSVGAAATP
ncbi:MAG TPA: hypothetical protein VF789_32985 [Thermoanaerobaculia bacterium]